MENCHFFKISPGFKSVNFALHIGKSNYDSCKMAFTRFFAETLGLSLVLFWGWVNILTQHDLFSGTCILIHGQVVHRSDHNKSDKSRHAYTFHVYDAKNSKYSEDNWLQTSEGFKSIYKNYWTNITLIHCWEDWYEV